MASSSCILREYLRYPLWLEKEKIKQEKQINKQKKKEMKKVITILILLIAASTLSAQPTNPLTPKSRPHERETLRPHERTLPNGKVIRDAKADAGKTATGKDIKNATLKMDSVTYEEGKDIFEYDDMGRTTIWERWEDLNCVYRGEYSYNAQGYLNQAIYYDGWESIDNQLVLSEKEEYTYENSGNKISRIRYNWNNELNQWREQNKIESEYDVQGRLTMYAYYDWDNDVNQWRGQVIGKTEYIYDAQGKSIKTISYDWDNGLSLWRKDRKYEEEFDANGSVIMEARYEWDNGLNDWKGSYEKRRYEYDTHGNLIKSIWYAWDNELNDWVEGIISEYQWEYQYNNNQQITQAIVTSSEGEIQFKQEFAYDTQGNQILKVYYEYFYGVWRERGKSEWEYDAQGNKILEVDYRYDDSGRKESKSELIYDAQGNLTTYNQYYWNEELNDWKKRYTFDVIHNLSYTWEDIICPDFIYEHYDVFGTPHTNIILEYGNTDWEDNLSEWVAEPRFIYHYSEITTSINNHPQHNISIYPNPVHDRLYIKSEQPIEQVQVYDLSGRLLIQEHNVSHSISMGNLTHGIYLVKAAGSVWKVVKN